MSILDGLSSINALFPLQLERRQTITLHHLPFPESRRHDSSGSDVSFFHSGSATSDYLLSVTPCNTPHARGMAWAQTHGDSQLPRLSAPTGPIRPAYDPTSLTTALPAPSFPISGRLAGVGLRLSEIAPHRVVEIAHNGPACQSDAIRVHDILLAVDDVACAAGEVAHCSTNGSNIARMAMCDQCTQQCPPSYAFAHASVTSPRWLRIALTAFCVYR